MQPLRPCGPSIHNGTTESYTYDGDGERVLKVVGGVTTVYFQGLFEQTFGVTWKQYYQFNGQTVAVRDSVDGLSYLHSDHLGSVSLATWKDANGTVQASQQEFDPWGAVRGGNVPQTSMNYTGQRLDGTGLLYYHARMYDPVLGRFVSADSVVPGSASGSMDGVQLKPLTVDFHEVGFVSSLNGENGLGFWFQMSGKQRQQAGSPWGPQNPQSLNRYSYVLNGPMKATDPTGHDRVEGYADDGSMYGDGKVYGYQEVRDQYGEPVMDNGQQVYEAYVCNMDHTDCTSTQISENDPDFVQFKTYVDKLVTINEKELDLAIGAGLVTAGGIITCAFSFGLGCVAAGAGAAALTGGFAVLKQQEWETAKSIQKHFNGLWKRGRNKIEHSPLPAYPYPNNSPAPWYP